MNKKNTPYALKLSKLGFRVKEMTGGLVWWKERFEYPVESGKTL